MSEGPGKFSADTVRNIAWGTHFCQFYRTQEDLMEILIPYFEAGLENNEFCIWIIPEFFKVKEEAIENIRKAIPQLEVYLEKGQIEIIHSTDLYIKEGIFDPEAALNYLIKKVNQALKHGYNGLRLTEDLSRLRKDRKKLIDYEEELDSVTGAYKIKALCTYSLDQCELTDIIDSVMNHHFSMLKREGTWEKVENSKLKKVEERTIHSAKGMDSKSEEEREIQAAKEIDSESKKAYGNLEKLLEERAEKLKKAHESLKESEKRLSQVQKMAHVGSWKWNILTGELYWNDEVYRIFGRNPGEFSPTYDAYLSQVHPDDRDYLISAIKKGFDGNLQNIDYRIILPDGEIRAINTQAEIILDEKNIPVRAEGIIQDITERKQAEEAHRKSEERYRMLFTNMSEASFLAEIICDINGKPYDYRFLETNPAFESHSGVKGEQVLGKSHLEVFHKANPTVIKKYGEVALSGIPTHFEFFTWLTSRYLDIYVFSPERGKFAATFRDITERKQIEEQTRRRAEEIETVMEVAPVAIWIGHDPQCHNITGNRMANRLYEAKVGENVSANTTPVRRLFHKGHELAADELPMQKAVFKDIDVRNEEIDVLLPSGEWIAILGSASPLHDARGNVRGSVAAYMDITERKRMEEALKKANKTLEEKVKERTEELEKAYNSLKEKETSLAEAQRMAHIGNWELDLVTGEACWSDELYSIFGRNPQEAGAKYNEFLNYLHPDDRDYVDNAHQKALNGIPYGVEYRVVRENGEERTVHMQSEVICDEENIPVRLKGIAQDITERKKAEQMLKESEGKLKTLFELLPIGVSITDKDRNILAANPSLERILELSRSDLLRGTWGARKYINSNGTEMSAEEFPSIRALKEKGSIQNSEIGVIKEDGSTIWTDVIATSLPFSDGQVVIATRDITRSKKIAEELQKAEEKYRIIAEQTGQLVYEYNVEEDSADWAGNIEEITGYTSDKFRNMNIQFLLSCIHPEDRKTFLKSYERFLTYGGTYRSEYRFRKENGEYIYLEDHGVCLKNNKGKVERILGATKNITERKQAERALANIEAARKREIHHRIKNNLQVISSLLDLQAEKFRSRKQTENSDVLAAFKESQDRVLSIALIHEELHEGKGTDKLHFCPYLERLVENLFGTYKVGNKNISLDMDIEENIFFDMDVSVPLGLIVNEIVSNSLKHAFSGRDNGIIRIKLCREKNGESTGSITRRRGEDYKSKATSFNLTISDNGVGLPDNFNLEDSDTLGLQLISILVDQLEGKLELKTDFGTEFVIKFAIPEKE